VKVIQARKIIPSHNLAVTQKQVIVSSKSQSTLQRALPSDANLDYNPDKPTSLTKVLNATINLESSQKQNNRVMPTSASASRLASSNSLSKQVPTHKRIQMTDVDPI